MRRRRPSVCSKPGCFVIVELGSRCVDHRTRMHQPELSASERGYDRGWQAVSKAYLAEHPECAWPECDQPAVVTDHVDGLGPLGPRGFDEDNFQGLCRSHHWTKTVRYDGGLGNPRLSASERRPGWTGLGVDGWGGVGPPAVHVS